MGRGTEVLDGMEGTSIQFKSHGGVYACVRASVTMKGQKSKFCVSYKWTVLR